MRHQPRINGATKCCTHFSRGLPISNSYLPGAEVEFLRLRNGQGRVAATRRNTYQGEQIRVVCDYFQRLGTNGTGASEDQNFLSHAL